MFSNSNGISAAFLYGNLLVDLFVSLAGLGVFFSKFLVCFSSMLFYSFLSALDAACLSIAFPFNSSSPNSSAKSLRRKGARFNFPGEGIILNPGKTFQS